MSLVQACNPNGYDVAEVARLMPIDDAVAQEGVSTPAGGWEPEQMFTLVGATWPAPLARQRGR